MSSNPAGLLRLSLMSNATFSGVSGAALIAAAVPLSELLGSGPPVILTIVGGSLLVFAIGLLAMARQPAIDHRLAWLAVGLDLAWVLMSGALLLAGVFTLTGSWIVAIVADIVLLFAILQTLGLRRMHCA